MMTGPYYLVGIDLRLREFFLPNEQFTDGLARLTGGKPLDCLERYASHPN